MADPKTYSLKLTSALAIGGEIHTAGSVITGVPEVQAKALLNRGKAELASDTDVLGDGDDSVFRNHDGELYADGKPPGVGERTGEGEPDPSTDVGGAQSIATTETDGVLKTADAKAEDKPSDDKNSTARNKK